MIFTSLVKRRQNNQKMMGCYKPPHSLDPQEPCSSVDFVKCQGRSSKTEWGPGSPCAVSSCIFTMQGGTGLPAGKRGRADLGTGVLPQVPSGTGIQPNRQEKNPRFPTRSLNCYRSQAGRLVHLPPLPPHPFHIRGGTPKPTITFWRAGPLSCRLPPLGECSGSPSAPVNQLEFL